MEPYAQAKAIVEILAKAGFVAYFAGGWVRDFLLNHPSDDVDIATNAPPETIQALFPHTVPIGISFGIILVIFEGHPFEVATFRRDIAYKDGRRPTQIEFTTAVEDARRRDFTINGMFYDPLKKEILDFVEGRADLEAKIIRAIGNPHERIREDRLRMIRAIRFACRFGFQIETQTEKAIRAHVDELFPAVAVERIWQEIAKGHVFGKLHPMLIQLHAFGLLSAIFEELKGVPLSEIETRLAPIQDYPSDAPVIASLLPLFPGLSTAQKLELCKRLKLSNEEVQFVSFLESSRQLICEARTSSVELVKWVYFYANPSAQKCLQILGAEIEPKRRSRFFEEHRARREDLRKSIERIQERNPVVKSGDLLEAGVLPGVAMGLLLKEGERIAINEQIEEAGVVIERLKRLAIWPVR